MLFAVAFFYFEDNLQRDKLTRPVYLFFQRVLPTMSKTEQETLARIAGHTYQLEAARIITAGAVDAHIKPAVVSAIAKYHMTEKSHSVIEDAMDVHAGRGSIPRDAGSQA